jgi:hypothetical protein
VHAAWREVHSSSLTFHAVRTTCVADTVRCHAHREPHPLRRLTSPCWLPAALLRCGQFAENTVKAGFEVITVINMKGTEFVLGSNACSVVSVFRGDTLPQRHNHRWANLKSNTDTTFCNMTSGGRLNEANSPVDLVYGSSRLLRNVGELVLDRWHCCNCVLQTRTAGCAYQQTRCQRFHSLFALKPSVHLQSLKSHPCICQYLRVWTMLDMRFLHR